MQRVERQPNLSCLVWSARINEDAFGLVRDRLQQRRIVVGDYDVAVLVAFLRDDAVFDDRNRRALAGSEADGDDREAHLGSTFRF